LKHHQDLCFLDDPQNICYLLGGKERWIMPAPHDIIELVERFEENLAAYTSGTYNETQLRRAAAA
jgi:hypothetical protein